MESVYVGVTAVETDPKPNGPRPFGLMLLFIRSIVGLFSVTGV